MMMRRSETMVRLTLSNEDVANVEHNLGSPEGSSDNDADETMRDVEDGDADMDADGELEAEGEHEGDDDAGSQSDASQGSDDEEGPSDQAPNATQDQSQTAPLVTTDDSATRGLNLSSVRPEALTASLYDIVPTIAAPQATSINAICATADTRWVFTGGADGYIRKFNWVDSVNSKLMLTVAQRHPFVDSVVKAGVLMTYWENWDVRSRPGAFQSAQTSQVLSPVYSLACQHQSLWLLAGTASGSIRLQSVRHDEGKEIHLLQKHTSAVSVLTLASDERSLLSGSWDKTVLDWDLETGRVRTAYAASASQISAIESRPMSSLSVPPESGEPIHTNGTFTSNNQAPSLTNGVDSRAPSQPPETNPPVATPDSLFGGDEGDDDLFGDSAGGVMTNGADLPDAFGDEPDAMDRAITDAAPSDDVGDQAIENSFDEQSLPVAVNAPVINASASNPELTEGVPNTAEQPLANGLPHAEDMESDEKSAGEPTEESGKTPTSDSTFLATSIDGAIRVWDRRQPDPVARILPRNTPPWCLSACWSPDGNYIFAGRRNNTVEEYDLRKGLKGPERIFKFPNGSGAVTSVRAMPNGRHLIW